MIRTFLRKKKILAAGLSAALVATAFQPTGCTINIDQNLLNMLQGIVGDIANGSDSSGQNRPFFMQSPPCLHDGSCTNTPDDTSGDDDPGDVL